MNGLAAKSAPSLLRALDILRELEEYEPSVDREQEPLPNLLYDGAVVLDLPGGLGYMNLTFMRKSNRDATISICRFLASTELSCADGLDNDW